MRRVLSSCVLIFIVPFLACSSSKNIPSIISFTATPSSLPIRGGTVNLQWLVTGASTLNIDHGVGAVSGTSTNAAVSSTTAYTLSATNDSGTATQTTAVTVSSATTVSGQVTYSDRTTGLPNARVLLAGQAPIDADSGGHFTVSNVIPPYTLSVTYPKSGTVSIYQGLTRPDPVLSLNIVAPPSRSSKISGQLNGSCCTFSTTSSPNATAIGFDSADTQGNTGMVGATSGFYDLVVDWLAAAPSSISGNFYALQAKCPNGNSCLFPASYLGFVSSPSVSLNAGDVTSSQNFSLLPVATSHVTGTVLAAPGYHVSENHLQMLFPHGLVFLLAGGLTTSTSFDFPVPTGTPASFQLSPTATNSAGASVTTNLAGIVPGTSGINIPMAAAPTLGTPSDAAVLSAAPQLNWIGSTDQVFELVIKNSHYVGLEWRILTHATIASLPDLSAFTSNLEPNTTYNWSVRSYSPISSLDAFSASGAPPTSVSGSIGVSQSQSFTTAP